MTTYTVKSEWDPAGAWVSTVPDVPGAVTQSKRLDLVPADAAEVISLMTDTEVDPGDIVIEWSAPADVETAARKARRLREEAALAQESANAETVAAVRRLHERGLSTRDVGKMVGVSHQYAARVVKRRNRHTDRKVA